MTLYDDVFNLIWSKSKLCDTNKNNESYVIYGDDTNLLHCYEIQCIYYDEKELKLIEKLFDIKINACKPKSYVALFENISKGVMRCDTHEDTDKPSLTYIMYNYDKDKVEYNRLFVNDVSSFGNNKYGKFIKEEMPPLHKFCFGGDHAHYAERNIITECKFSWIILSVDIN